jgi:hypothetical protein
MTSGSDDELLCDAVVAFVIAQRRLLAVLNASDEERATVTAAMTAELDQLEAAIATRAARRDEPRPGDPGE